MKLVYKFYDFIKIYKYNLKNKFINVKDFHYIKLNNAAMVLCENNKKMVGKCDLRMFKLFLKMYKNVLKQ